MRDATDEALMIDYANGNLRAFEILYERYRLPLFRYFRRQAGPQTVAEDLYQGCWEKVIRARERYDPEAPFRAWLFRIAHNHLVDSYRARRPTASLEVDPPDPAHRETGQALDDVARRVQLRQALQELPEEQREAMLLKLDADLSLEEIAQITGVGTETAKSRLRYATAKLKRALRS
jgi:RNA polymerase sigma-70 factor (ECF subfamily)